MMTSHSPSPWIIAFVKEKMQLRGGLARKEQNFATLATDKTSD